MQLKLVGNFSVRKVLEKSLILILCHFSLVPVPDGLEGVDKLAVQLDRIGYEERVFFKNLLHL